MNITYCDETSHNKYLIPLIFIATILIILLFWLLLPSSYQTNESSDFLRHYEPVARNIISRVGLVTLDGSPATTYPPGYSLILAALFALSNALSVPEQLILSTFVTVAMGSTSILIYLLARNYWGPRLALIPAALWITYPFALWSTKQQNSETSFLPVFYGAFYLLWYASTIAKQPRWYLYFFSGLLVGAAMLIRPIALGIGPLFGAIICFTIPQVEFRRRLLYVVVLLLGTLLLVLPWEGWLYLQTNEILPLSDNGVSSMRDGLTFAVNTKGYRQTILVPTDVRGLMLTVQERTEAGALDTTGAIVRLVAVEFKEQPLTTTKLFIIKAVRSWYATDSGRFENFALPIQLLYLTVSLYGSWKMWQRGDRRELIVAIWLIVFYFWSMTTIALSILRYMFPAMGLLFIFIPGAFVRRTNPGT